MRIVLAILAAYALLWALPSAAVAQAGWDAERARIEAQQRDQQAQQAQQADMARQQSLAAQRETDAALARQQTESTLRGLEDQRRYPPQTYPAPATASGRAVLDSQMRSDAARLDALTDRLLADSNARIRAIKPASR